VGRSNHNTDGFAIEPLASQASENPNAKNDRVQGVPSGYDTRGGDGVVWIDKASNSQCPKTCGTILKMKVGWLWVGIRVVFDGGQGELGHGGVGERSWPKVLTDVVVRRRSDDRYR
jgi:hypothetical protein